MRNWTIKDAVAVIQNGKDTEAIKEIAKHFPIFFMAVAKNDLGAVAAMMTEKMTVRRLQEADEAEASDAEDAEAEEAEAEDTESEETGDADLENMSTKELYNLCCKKGIKVPKYGKNKAFYIEALQGGAEEKEAEAEDDSEEEDDPYVGKNAIQLYSLCKKRGIKVQPKQKAAVYLKALHDADAKADEDADSDAAEEEDWDDEEEEEKPAKKAPAKKADKKAAPAKEEKKPAKKAEKKAEAEDDDDDDWDL